MTHEDQREFYTCPLCGIGTGNDIDGTVEHECEIAKEMYLQNESEWELKLQEKIKENKFVTPSSHLDAEEIKSFIQETLSNREKEIAEEVEKTYGKDGGPALVIIESHEGGVTQRPALNEVLQILKH